MRYFTCRAQKIFILAVLKRLALSQDGGQYGDHVWWRHRPPAAPPPVKYTSSCREDQRLSTDGKSFRNTATYQKLNGRGGGGGSLTRNSAPEVFCSSSFTHRTHFERSLVMVSYHSLNKKQEIVFDTNCFRYIGIFSYSSSIWEQNFM